jgi:hypothetical protein
MRSLLPWLAPLFPLSAFAADHADAPLVRADPSADITDLYAWMSPDATRLNLVMNVAAAAFSDAGLYVFHVESSAAYGQPGQVLQIICAFEVNQTIECWAGANEDHARGSAAASGGLVSDRGWMRIFAGPRNDPFFFNRAGLSAAANLAGQLVLVLDGAGCPQLTSPEPEDLTAQLSAGPGGAPAEDAFALDSVSSLVISVDKSLVTRGGPIVAVWGSTHVRL